MRWLAKLSLRMRSLFHRRAADDELDAELRSHLERQISANVSAGMSQAEARRAAMREFGSVESLKEECRDMRKVNWLQDFAQDLRYGLRMLRKSPAFTTIAVLTLALGIGANTAIFSVVEGVILKPLPYDNPDRLARIYQSDLNHGRMRMMDSAVDIDTARRQNSVFENIAYYQEWDATLTGLDEPEQIAVAYVSPGFLTVLGERPIAGRSFLPEEHQPGRDQVVVLSNSLSHRLFTNAPDAVGQVIRLDGKPYTVVGVMPVGFQFPRSEPPITTSAWIPWSKTSEQEGRNKEVAAIARLKPGASFHQAQTQMDAISSRLARVYPDDAGWKFDVVPLQTALLGDTRLAILIIFAAVGFVLLIACANLASLLIGRAATRQKEMAIRAAIGASRCRIIRQLLTESVLLALGGGTAGLAIAAGAIRVLRAEAPKDIPRLLQVHLSASVLAFTVAVSVAIGILFGLVPALRASRPLLGSSFNERFMPGPAAPGGRRRAQRSLPVFQVALSLVLLVGAGLMARSFLRLTSVDLGFQPRNCLTFWIDLSSVKYGSPASRLAFYQQTLERIKALPGVESATISSTLVLTGGIGVFAAVEGHHYPPAFESNSKYQAVSPDYFRALQIPLVSGRLFTDGDNANSPFVAIVNQAFVRQNFPNENPLGKRIRISMAASNWRSIVGVVGDVREDGIAKEPSPEAYFPFVQAWITPSCAYVVRTRTAPLSLAKPIRSAILAVDKDQPIVLVQTMDEILSDESAPLSFRAGLLGLFSLLALVLTAVGLYGIMVYSVVQRTHEIGVRMALGAHPRDILRMVLGEGLLLAVIGVTVGICGALALTRFLASLLFEIKPTDPVTFVGVAILLLLVALLACYIPARRAMRVDPMVALRYE